jgi:hypothetical protein
MAGGGGKKALGETSGGAGGVRAELLLDADDFYNRYGRWVVLPALLWYLYNIFSTPSMLEELAKVNDTRPDAVLTSVARDSGLKMTMKTVPPEYLVNLHSMSGLALFLCVMVQKHTVREMVFKSYKKYAPIHRAVGCLCLLFICGMTFGGYMLGAYSAFEGFDIFSIFFAAPWICWLFGIYLTGQPTTRMLSVHRLLGNMLLKGCIAVPISRIAGAALQKVEGWNEVSGFYQGIGGVSFLIFLWQSYDIYHWYRRFVQLPSGTTTAAGSSKYRLPSILRFHSTAEQLTLPPFRKSK